MISLVRWEPFTDLRHIMARMFEDSVRPVTVWRGFIEMPNMPLDMYQTADEVVVKAKNEEKK